MAFLVQLCHRQLFTPRSVTVSKFRLIDYRQMPPPNARTWRQVFDIAVPSAEIGMPIQQALDKLNFAELAFWEENIVPVRVTKVEVQWNGDRGDEFVQIDQVFDDPHFPINQPIRQEQPPDFATILQDKIPPIEVDLSNTPDLWDREKQESRWVERTFTVPDVPERAAGQVRTLQLTRPITRGAPQTPTDLRAYFKTRDQGWQMGVFQRRRLAIQSLPRRAILAEVLGTPTVRQRRVEPVPLTLSYDPWSQEKDRLVGNTLATAPLFLVQGPPGTGKSTYVAGLMRYILSEEEDPGARLLVVANMHYAIDELAQRVQKLFDAIQGAWERPLILRLRTPRNEYEEQKADREMADKAHELFADCLDVLSQRRSDPVYDAACGQVQEVFHGFGRGFLQCLVESDGGVLKHVFRLFPSSDSGKRLEHLAGQSLQAITGSCDKLIAGGSIANADAGKEAFKLYGLASVHEGVPK